MKKLRLFAAAFAICVVLSSFGKTEDWALRVADRSMWFSTAESSPGKMLMLFSSPWEADVSRDESGKVTLTYSYSHPDHPDWAWTKTLSFVPTDADEMECEFFETRANRLGGDIRAKGVAKRIPPLPPAPDLGKLTFGEPIDLLADGLDGWESMGDRKSHWTFKDGVLENCGGGGANIRTKRGDFTDFRLSYDVRADKGCNSGIYLRGLYEIQTIDSYGKEPDSHNMGAVYGRVTPSVTADRPAGEWQHVDVTLCDRHATVVLNGVKIIDNAPLRGITGGALSPDQFAPGPIMIQGSHNGGAYRKMVLTPIVSAEAAAPEPPLFSQRLRRPHTESDGQWAKTFRVLRENRQACDEVWFSTGIGFPKIGWHEEHAARLVKYADELRAIGIVPSLQFQATLGHSDDVTVVEGAEAKTWGGYVGRKGDECQMVNCPRQPAFLSYMRRVARLYAAFRPGSVWLDGDLRIAGHRPVSPWDREKDGWVGCWCDLCVDAFNRSTGGTWTRETLDAAMRVGTPLYDSWERFSFASIAQVARAIAEEMHAVSPETRFGYQHAPHRNDAQLTVFKAMYDASGHAVGSRPGGGAYFDYDPHSQNVKAVLLARQRRCLGERDMIDVWCPEIDTYPRAFASRTAQGILNECLVNLAMGMNSLSLLIMDTRYETDEWYGENLLKPLADAKPLLDEFRRHNKGAAPAGLADATTVTPEELYRFALAGVPVLPGPGREYGEVRDDDISSFSISKMSSSALLDLRRRMDERSGGRMPVVVETPTVGLVVPWVVPSGELRSVAFVNARIDVQKPARVRLRGVPSDVKFATWWAFHRKPVAVPVEREGADAIAVMPSLAAWNCAWLSF